MCPDKSGVNAPRLNAIRTGSMVNGDFTTCLPARQVHSRTFEITIHELNRRFTNNN